MTAKEGNTEENVKNRQQVQKNITDKVMEEITKAIESFPSLSSQDMVKIFDATIKATFETTCRDIGVDNSILKEADVSEIVKGVAQKVNESIGDTLLKIDIDNLSIANELKVPEPPEMEVASELDDNISLLNN